MARINPFAYVDYAPTPGMPRGNADEPIGPRPVPIPENPPPPSASAEAKASFWRQEVQRITNAAPKGSKTVRDPDTREPLYISEGESIDPQFKEALDNAQTMSTYWEGKAYEEAVTYPRTRADKAADEAAATERSRISAGATLGAAGISAGASAFSAQEATRRQGQQLDWQTGESALGREFTGSENALNRAGTIENTTLSNRLAGEREAAGRDFEGQQNALDRQIRNVQNQIAQGELDLKEGLGILQKYLDAQPYTLPQGAEYVPGFQPGGAVQEASRLAGVGYNPANYKAKTVAFDPQAMVRQTMGR